MKAEPPSAHRFFFGERQSGTRCSFILFGERPSGTRYSSIPFGERPSGTRTSSIPFGERPSGTRVSFILFGERPSGTRVSSILFGERPSGTRAIAIPFGERLSGTRYSSILFGERLSEPPDSHFHISMIPHQHHPSFNCRLLGGRTTRSPDCSCHICARAPLRMTGSNRSPWRSGAGRPTNSRPSRQGRAAHHCRWRESPKRGTTRWHQDW